MSGIESGGEDIGGGGLLEKSDRSRVRGERDWTGRKQPDSRAEASLATKG